MPRLLIILLFLHFTANAQQLKFAINKPAIKFDVPEVLKKAGVKDVRCIFKDSRGFMWFGTSNGLFRFDGTNIVYKRKLLDNPASLPDNIVVTLAEDKQGNIWIGTFKGVSKMNPYNLKCFNYTQANKLLPDDFDSKVFIDNQGTVWVGTGKGLYLHDEKLNRFINVWQQKNKEYPGFDYITCITMYDENTIALGTFNGVLLFDKLNKKATRVPYKTSPEGTPATSIFTDSRKNLWIGTWGTGFYLYDKSIRKFNQVNCLPGSIVKGFAETGDATNATLWITTDMGLLKLPLPYASNVNESSAFFYKHDATVENTIPGSAGTIFKDETGTMWMAGPGETGIVKFNPELNIFNTLPISLKGTIVDIQPIDINNKKFYCISSWHSITGLTITDDRWRVIKQFEKLPEKSNETGINSISGVATDRLNRIWVATLGGLSVLDSSFNLIKAWSAKDTGMHRLSKAKTNAILISGDTVWIACYKAGIDLFNLQYKKLAHFADGEHGLHDDLFWKFYKDSRNNIWVCGNKRLYLFDRQNKTFKSFALLPASYECGPKDIVELPDGNLMIASDNGLIHFNVNTHQYEYIRSPLLQREENIFSVATDNKNNVWYLTADHLVQYNLTTKRFTLFGDEDGLKSEKGMQVVRSFVPDTITVCQNNQVLQFENRPLKNTMAPPAIQLTNLQVNDSSIQFSHPATAISLQHFQNKIYFEFTGITYTKPEQNQYAFQLEGVDEDWIVSNRNFASYANLAPGHYNFKVKASNYAGIWSNDYKLAIYIAPPFWKTWWFIGLAVLVIGAVFILIVRYISQRNLRERILILEREQAIEKERNRIARDMHDDLGSGLTKIAILSEVAKKQLTEPAKASTQLQNISQSSRELVDNLQDIIWVLNPKNDSLENLAAYIREYALKFFEPVDVKLEFNYPSIIPTVKLSEEVRRNIFLVIKETFNNIARHAQSKNVSISLSYHHHSIKLVIDDNGKGFDAGSIRSFANGLLNMQNRMEQLGGNYTIQSSPGTGTQTRLQVPV